MRGQNHRLALLLQALQNFPNLAPCPGVETCCRLVEEHDLGVVHECNRNSKSLPQAPGEVLVLLFCLVLEVHEFDQPVDIGFHTAEKPRVILQGLSDSYPVERTEPLRENADAVDDVMLILRDIHSQKCYFTRRWSADCIHNLYGSSLAGAVRAQQGEHLTFIDRERYVVNRQQISVALRQFVDFDYIFSYFGHESPFRLCVQ